MIMTSIQNMNHNVTIGGVIHQALNIWSRCRISLIFVNYLA